MMANNNSSGGETRGGAAWSNGDPVAMAAHFGLGIMQFRRERKMKLADVARRMGYKPVDLYKVEHGGIRPSPATRQAFADLYSTTVEALDEAGRNIAAQEGTIPRCAGEASCFAMEWLEGAVERAGEEKDVLEEDTLMALESGLAASLVIACDENGGAQGVVSPVTPDNCGVLRAVSPTYTQEGEN